MSVRHPRPARGGESGFSLLEVMLSATIFMVVSGAVVTALVVSNALNTTNRESALAARAAQSLVEELKGVTFAEIYARYDSTTADDPVGGASPGDHFAVAGLDVRKDDGDGFVGSVRFPGTGTALREDVEDVELGLPRDLDGDGATDAADHAGDYRILPVRVRVEWTGKSGRQALELITVLTAP